MACYVTYYWSTLYGRTPTRAIKCKDLDEAIDCAHDIVSFDALKNVRINQCGRLPKGTEIISYGLYQKYPDML